jgi:hypothetical protein
MVVATIRIIIMRYEEVRDAYPYVATIKIDPADVGAIERAADERDQFKIVAVDRTTGGTWKVLVACASRRVLEGVQERFG